MKKTIAIISVMTTSKMADVLHPATLPTLINDMALLIIEPMKTSYVQTLTTTPQTFIGVVVKDGALIALTEVYYDKEVCQKSLQLLVQQLPIMKL